MAVVVCQCNVVLAQEVRDAACRILAADPAGGLAPQFVFRELQKSGQCCSCYPTIAAIVAELLADALTEIDGVGLVSASPLKQLMPKDA